MLGSCKNGHLWTAWWDQINDRCMACHNYTRPEVDAYRELLPTGAFRADSKKLDRKTRLAIARHDAEFEKAVTMRDKYLGSRRPKLSAGKKKK